MSAADRLPFETVERFLSNGLSNRTLITCSCVSKTWRHVFYTSTKFRWGSSRVGAMEWAKFIEKTPLHR